MWARDLDSSRLTDAIHAASHPLDNLDPLIERIGDSRIVLLGEASHGTSEYYTWRARISRRLIEEKGFNFIAVEGDWPDCYRVNRFVKGYPGAGDSAEQVLHTFDRWPTWMWANWEIAALTNWLRMRNASQPEHKRVGFYGLDVYSLWQSLDAVQEHLRKNHPDLVTHGENIYACFEPFNRDEHQYAWSTVYGLAKCEDELLDLLKELQEKAPQHPEDPEEHFNAEQNAHAAVGAERYYRTMVRADGESWNVRDTHMADTLDRLLQRYGEGAKAIVWEHNTHVGDARYTDMREAGMTNIGQLARERHADNGVYIVGFGSYEGSVIAGRRWGAPMERMTVPKARSGSWEHLLRQSIGEDRLIFVEGLREMQEAEDIRGHRAIGVVYNPEQERLGNYVPTNLPHRYDAFMYVDRTNALHPLKMEPGRSSEPPETFPWGF